MKNLLFIICLLLSTQSLGQTVSSSCAVSPSIEQLYWHDVPRIAMNWMNNSNSPDKDSPFIPPAQLDSVMEALAAVYNATSLSSRDTVVDILSIHLPYNGYDVLTLQTEMSMNWDEAWDQMLTLTGDNNLDSLFSEYQLYLATGDSTFIGYIANFKSPLMLNMDALVPLFTPIAGVINAQDGNFYTGMPETFIFYQVDSGNRILTYRKSWGDCPAGCFFNRDWKFKVSPNCEVTYLGSSGDPLPIISSFSKPFSKIISATPNPFRNIIELSISSSSESNYSVTDMLGRTIISGRISAEKHFLNTQNWPSGIYVVRVSTPESVETVKLIKE